MNIILAILLIFLLFGGGGFYAGPGPVGYGSWGLGSVLVVILIVLALTGRL